MSEKKSSRELAEEAVAHARAAIEAGHGRMDVRWEKWSREFNLGLRARAESEPEVMGVFTLWALLSRAIEMKAAGKAPSSDDVESIRFTLSEVGAKGLDIGFLE